MALATFFKVNFMHNNQSPWRARVQELFQVCQNEFKRTTKIGKKMLSASKTNSKLHNTYEELGMLVVRAIENGSLEWNHPRVKELVHEITSCEKDLETIEREVDNIRFSKESDHASSRKVENGSSGRGGSSSHFDSESSN